MKLKKGQTYSRKQLCEIMCIKFNAGSDNIKAFENKLSKLCEFTKEGKGKSTKYTITKVFTTKKDDKRAKNSRPTRYNKNVGEILTYNAIKNSINELEEKNSTVIYSKTQLFKEAEFLPKWYYSLTNGYKIIPENNEGYSTKELRLKGMELLNYSDESFNLLILQSLCDLVSKYFTTEQLINALNESDKCEVTQLKIPHYKCKDTRWKYKKMNKKLLGIWNEAIDRYPIKNSNVDIVNINFNKAVEYFKDRYFKEIVGNCQLFISPKPFKIEFKFNDDDIVKLKLNKRKLEIIMEQENIDNQYESEDFCKSIVNEVIISYGNEEYEDVENQLTPFEAIAVKYIVDHELEKGKRMEKYIESNYNKVKKDELLTFKAVDRYFKAKYLYDNKHLMLETYKRLEADELLKVVYKTKNFIEYVLKDNLIGVLSDNTIVVKNTTYENLVNYVGDKLRYKPYVFDEEYQEAIANVEEVNKKIFEEQPFEKVIETIQGDNDDIDWNWGGDDSMSKNRPCNYWKVIVPTKEEAEENAKNNELYQDMLAQIEADVLLEEQALSIDWLEIAEYIYKHIYRPIYDSCNNVKVKKTINKLIKGMKQLSNDDTTTIEYIHLRKLYLSDKDGLFEYLQECLYKEAKVKLPKNKPQDLKKPTQESLDKQLEELKELEEHGIIDKSVIDRFIEITK